MNKIKELSNPIERLTIKLQHGQMNLKNNRLTALQWLTGLTAWSLICLLDKTQFNEFNIALLVVGCAVVFKLHTMKMEG